MSATTFLVMIACLLLAAKAAGWLCQRAGIPAVLGQLLIGVLLGPSLLHWVHADPTLNDFANIGVILLMFIAGMETDMQQMRRVGGAALISATCGVVVPFVAGAAFARLLGYPLVTSLFLGTLLTATSVSISAQTLKDLGKLSTRAGTTILGAAVIDDVLGLIVLSFMLAFTLGQNPTWAILKMAIYFPIVYLLGYYGFPLLSRWLPRLLALEVRIGLVLAVILLYAWSAESLGNVAAITGAYIAGILVSRTDMREWVNDGISKIGYAFFVPLFFVYVGIESDFRSIAHTPPLLLFGLVGIAIVTKIIGCGGGAWLCRFTPFDALTVGVGMISRGEVALVTATIGLQAGIINSSIFSLVILISLITTIVTPLLLKLVYAFQPGQRVAAVKRTEPLPDILDEVAALDAMPALQEETHVH